MEENQEVQTSNFWNGRLSRRTFLGRAALVAGGSVVALACGAEATTRVPAQVPPTRSPGLTEAPTPPAEPGQSNIEAGPVEFESKKGKLLGYLSRPHLPGTPSRRPGGS